MKIGNYKINVWSALKSRVLNLFGLWEYPLTAWYYPLDGWVTDPKQIVDALARDDEFGFKEEN